MQKYTETDALPRVNKASMGSLARELVTEQYLIALRRNAYKWIEQIDTAIHELAELEHQAKNAREA